MWQQRPWLLLQIPGGKCTQKREFSEKNDVMRENANAKEEI